MTLSGLDLVQLLASYHALMLGVLLLMRRLNPGLGLMTLAFSTHMLSNLVTGQGLIPPAADITSAFGLLYGPLFYLFVRNLTQRHQRLATRDFLHLLPALIIAIARPPDPIPQIIGLPSLVIYIGFAIHSLRAYRQTNAQLRSDDHRVSLHWVEWSVGLFAALAALDIGRELAGPALPISDDTALALVIIAVIVLFTVMAARTRQHATLGGALDERAQAPSAPADRDEQAEADAVFADVHAWVTEEALWREPRFSLADLAAGMRRPAKEISRAINQGYGTSFSRYINGLRVEAVSAMMAEPENADRTVIELAYEAGFNSKSAFNRIYREMTGTTPTEAFQRARHG